MQVGIRNIIRASTNAVETIGFDLDELHGCYTTDLTNLRQGDGCSMGMVTYNGGRADLRGTQGVRDCQVRSLDFNRRFPVNQLATDLINQKCTKRAYFDPMLPMRGDASLVTDSRAHWCFKLNDGSASAEDIVDFNNRLVSPRDLIPGCYRYNLNPWIFFHEEPCERDILTIMMRWV